MVIDYPVLRQFRKLQPKRLVYGITRLLRSFRHIGNDRLGTPVPSGRVEAAQPMARRPVRDMTVVIRGVGSDTDHVGQADIPHRSRFGIATIGKWQPQRPAIHEMWTRDDADPYPHRVGAAVTSIHVGDTPSDRVRTSLRCDHDTQPIRSRKNRNGPFTAN